MKESYFAIYVPDSKDIHPMSLSSVKQFGPGSTSLERTRLASLSFRVPLRLTYSHSSAKLRTLTTADLLLFFIFKRRRFFHEHGNRKKKKNSIIF